MKRILILVAITLFLCSTATAFQDGGGKSTKKKADAKKTSETRSNNTTPPRPPAPPVRPKTPTVTSLMVNSKLPNVTVTINGRTAGTTAANGYLLLGSLKPGAYTVSVTKPGYQPDKIVLNLSAGQSETLNFELKPITQSLTISSTPPECEVYIDEILRGRTDASGNVRLADVPVGEHRVTIRKSRYREAIFPLSLSSDKEGQINANLELAIGFLTVTTNIPNARIDISGIGHFDSSISKFECQPGTYTITIASPLYVTSRKEVSVSAGQEAQLSVTLEVDSEARYRLMSEAQQAYSRKEYDRVINVANTLLSADSKNSQALTVLAQSYFMKDDFNSFTKFGNQAIEAGGSLGVPLRHKHGWPASVMHPVRLVLTAQYLSFDPQLAQDVWCPNKPFTASLTALGAAEVSGNRDNEINLRLDFVDPNKPKKTTTLTFAERESYLVEEKKNTAGGFVRYNGHTMVSRRQAYGAITAIAALLNRAKGNESSMATNKVPEVILDPGGSDPVTGTTTRLPTVESILEANITALGGKENTEKWTTVILSGTYIATKGTATGSGTFEEYRKGRSKALDVWKQETAGVVQENGYEGSAGWIKAYKTRPRVMTASELASTRQRFFLLSLTDVKEFREMYPESKLRGRGKMGERQVYVVEATPSAGRPQTLHFDAQTGLLVRWDTTYEDPDKEGFAVPVKVLYDDYVEIGGKKIPTTWRQITPTFTTAVKILEHRYDVPIDDAKFKMPTK